jgi:hypothetical protein
MRLPGLCAPAVRVSASQSLVSSMRSKSLLFVQGLRVGAGVGEGGGREG